MPTFDQGHDRSGRELLRVTEQYAAPEFVKAASSDAICGNGLPRNLYADPLNQLYPVHSPAATWTSYAFFLDKRAGDTSAEAKAVHAKLTNMARYFGIESTFAALEKTAQERRKDRNAELPDSAYAIVWKQADGTTERHVRLASADDVSDAAEWFLRYRDEMPFAERSKVAGKILAKAAAFGVPLDDPESLQKTAAIGSGPATQAIDLLYDRAGRIARKHPEVAETLVKTAQALEASPKKLRDHSQRMKLASVIDEVDRKTGLAREYAEGLPRPEDELFAVTPKTAADFVARHVTIPGGMFYRVRDIESLPVQDLVDRLGEDLTKAASSDGLFCDAEKLGAALAKAARKDVERFVAAADDLGVQPVGQDLAYERMDRATLQKLAAAAI